MPDIRIFLLIMLAAFLILFHQMQASSITAFNQCAETIPVEQCTVLFDGNPNEG